MGLNGEQIALEWSDVDFKQGTLTVARALPEFRRVSIPKTEKSARVIRLREDARRALERQRPLTALLCTLVFTSEVGTDMHPGNFNRRVWRRLLERAGVPYRPFKFTRHSYAVMRIEKGASGHRDRDGTHVDRDAHPALQPVDYRGAKSGVGKVKISRIKCADSSFSERVLGAGHTAGEHIKKPVFYRFTRDLCKVECLPNKVVGSNPNTRSKSSSTSKICPLGTGQAPHGA